MPGAVRTGRADRFDAPGWSRCWWSCSSICPSERTNRHRRLLRADLVAGEAFEDLLPGRDRRAIAGGGRKVLGTCLVTVPWPEAQRPDKRLDPGPDGGVRDAELALHVAQVAARPQEALEQGQLLLRQAAKPPDGELTLERRATGAAVQARDGELAGADGASGDHVVRHAVPFVCATTFAYRLS